MQKQTQELPINQNLENVNGEEQIYLKSWQTPEVSRLEIKRTMNGSATTGDALSASTFI